MKEFEKIKAIAETMKNGEVISCTQGQFLISGIIARYDKTKGWIYQIELKDLKAPSVIYAAPNKINITSY